MDTHQAAACSALNGWRAFSVAVMLLQMRLKK
jgi:hypothetical protein